MNWKPEVCVERGQIYKLKAESKEKKVATNDFYIVDAVEDGITEDLQLIGKIMEVEQMDEMIARFRLAQFVVDYGEFIEELTGHMMIEA